MRDHFRIRYQSPEAAPVDFAVAVDGDWRPIFSFLNWNMEHGDHVRGYTPRKLARLAMLAFEEGGCTLTRGAGAWRFSVKVDWITPEHFTRIEGIPA